MTHVLAKTGQRMRVSCQIQSWWHAGRENAIETTWEIYIKNIYIYIE